MQDHATFATITRGRDEGDLRVTDVPSGWAQGRSTFGGLVTGFGYEACAARAQAPPRLVTGRMLEFVTPGRVTARVQPIRVGRSVQAYSAVLTQDDRTVAIVDAVFGASRASVLHVPDAPCPAGVPDDAMRFGSVPGVTPEFLDRFDMRWLEGSPPFTGGTETSIGGFCRHRTDAEGVGAVLGLLDAWPSPVLGMADRPFASSTVQWTSHLTEASYRSGSWARFQSHTVRSQHGYASVHASLWSLDDGALLAWNDQLYAVYA